MELSPTNGWLGGMWVFFPALAKLDICFLVPGLLHEPFHGPLPLPPQLHPLLLRWRVRDRQKCKSTNSRHGETKEFVVLTDRAGARGA